MKWYYGPLVALAIVAILVVASPSRRSDEVEGDFFYKIETGGIQSGYAVIDTSLVFEDGEEMVRLEQRIHALAKLLGSDVDTEATLTYLLDPVTKRVRRHEVTTTAGENPAKWSMELVGDRAHCTSSLRADEVVLDLPPDTIIENTLFFGHVVEDFVRGDLTEKTYRVLEIADQQIQESRYEKHGAETITLAGAAYDVLVVDRMNLVTGTLARLWIDTETAMVVKVLEQDGNVITWADPSIVGTVERVDMDKYIFDKTDVAIADVTGITYMKVRARIRPVGLRPTPELLNVPGQRFTGTVVDNVVEGVFEIEHPRYNGTGAPAFPAGGDADTALAEYLAADGIFETDDEVLAAQAQEITTGAADSWEAATRLAAWVSDEISYAIPGGGTARNTYDIRAGECGAHSILLATFCRTVGIPARMVWGCMYTPNHGGSFGQHGWTEVHMGPAGWIPLDATVGENDYVDSGHIRIASYGSLTSRLNAQEFEILEYRVAGASVEATAAAEDRYAAYLGEYEHPQSSTALEIKVMDGSLVLDIPDQAMLALDEPDEQGRWVSRMATHIHVVFEKDDDGSVKSFTMHEVYSLPRKTVPDIVDDETPADLVRCLGTYYLAALSADFTVFWEHGGLALEHPRIDRALPLAPADQDGAWTTENGPYTISFVTGADGAVESLTLDAANEFGRK